MDALGYVGMVMAERIKIADPTGCDERRLQTLNDHLSRGGTALVPFNHPGTLDPVIVIRVLREWAGIPNPIVFPASQKFTSGRMGPLAQAAYARIQEEMNVEFVPLAQKNDPEALKSIAGLRRLLAACTEPGTIIPIAIQGTRSPNYRDPLPPLHEINRYIGRLKEGLVVPMAIWGSEKIHTTGSGMRFNPFAVAGLRVCTPIASAELVARTQNSIVTPVDLVFDEIIHTLDRTQPSYFTS